MKKEEKKKRPKPDYVPAVDRVRSFVNWQGSSTVPVGAGESNIKVSKPWATSTRYEDAPKFSWVLHQSKEEFEMVDRAYRETKDRYGVSMGEISRRYWDDPDYADELRAKIAAERRRYGR